MTKEQKFYKALQDVFIGVTIVFGVQYSERGAKTKQDELLKAIKSLSRAQSREKGIVITEEQLERASRVFEKQSEVEFADRSKINTKDLDYKLIKPLIWWE